MTKEQRIHPRIRIALLLAPWAMAMAVIVWFNSPVSFADFWGFPYGLSWFVFPSDWQRARAVDMAAVAAGWLLLLALTVICYRQARLIRYVAYYVALCLFLVLNIIGWHRFWAEITPLLKL